MQCPVCRYDRASERQISETYGTGDELFVIEHVPVISCPNCGQISYPVATVKRLEAIQRDRQTLAVKRTVEVAEYHDTRVEVPGDHLHAA